MKILVVGAGMYVTGRGGTGVGTILASLAECSRSRAITEVLVVARRADNAAVVQEAAQRLNGLLGTDLRVRYQAVVEGRALGDQLRLEEFACGVVVVPDHLHFGIAAELLERGVHALVVKPLVPTVAEARKLIAIQEKTGAYGAVEFHKRWDESNVFARKCIADGVLGELSFGIVEYSQRITIPTEVFRSWAERTNIFQYLGVHYVDLLHHLTGLKPLRAMAAGTRGLLAERGVDTWDSVHAQVIWGKTPADPRPFHTHLCVSWIDPPNTSALSDQRFKIIGHQGRIECDQKDRGIELITDAAGVRHPNPYFSEVLPGASGGMVFQGYGHRSVASFIGDVVDLRAGRVSPAQLEPIRPTFRQALVSTAVVEAVTLSLESNFDWRPVDATP